MKLYNNSKKVVTGKLLRGFTLIELLMVISIITLLSSILFSSVGTAQAKSRDAVRLSDMKQISTAANLYYEDTGMLPESIGGNNGLVPKYLSREPTDPKTGASYSFRKVNNGFVVSGTYETQFRSTDNQSQQVGIIIGDVSMTELCEDTANNDNYPDCDNGDSNDQILGVTSGHRRGGGSNVTEDTNDNISSCSIADIDKTCPQEPYATNCYCNGTINNTSLDLLNAEQCLQQYGLYWSGEVCVDEDLCPSIGGKWDGYSCVISLPLDPDLSLVCSDNGGVWYNNDCHYQNNYTTQTGCENFGGSWQSYPGYFKCYVQIDPQICELFELGTVDYDNYCSISEGSFDGNIP